MKQKESGRQFVFWLAGFAIGVLFSYFNAGDSKELNAYMGMQSMMEIALCQLDTRGYLFYLIRRRGLIFLILLFGAMTVMGKYILSAFLMFLGISMGTMGVFLLFHYGGKGIFLFFSLFFPQIICYVPAVYYMIRFLSVLHDKVFGERKLRYTVREKMLSPRQFFFAIGVTITGILFECYVNPVFVKFVMKIF